MVFRDCFGMLKSCGEAVDKLWRDCQETVEKLLKPVCFMLNAC